MAETKKAEVARAGARIRYWTKGDAGAPVVVCLHGVTLDHGAFAAQVRAPVLIVHGEREERWLVRMFRRWAARDARVRCEAVPDAGHLANQDNPAAFNELLLGFLRTIRGT